MEESKKREIYEKMSELAHKYKDVDVDSWDMVDKELACKLLLSILADSSRERTLYLEPAAEMTEETKRKLEEIKAKIKTKEYKISLGDSNE